LCIVSAILIAEDVFLNAANKFADTFFANLVCFMKLLIRIGVFLAIVAALAFAKIKYFPKTEGGTPMPQAGGGKGNAPAIGVNGYLVRVEKLDNKIFATGTAMASEIVDLKPEVAGKIVQMNIQEGKNVSKGQLLIKLNDADLQAQLKKLYAQMKLTEQSEQRLKKLLDIKGISQDEYDVIINQMNNIQADVEFTKAQIDKTELKAPLSGMIGLRSVSYGSYINAQSQIATIQAINPIKIDFMIPEKYVNAVRIGDDITFSTEGSKEKFSGKVYATENQIDPVSRTLKLRATAPNPSGKLKPGSFVKVDFSLKEIDNAILVPTEAIIPILKGQQVFVSREGVATPVVIEVGVRTDAKIQVLGGVQVGDTVITSGLMGLKPNTKVKFTKVL
jgi:membrane fusion protein, multidrug efflux system